ncbi:hypothetical protein GCM10018793_38510 [Streptomyces sulfonofaciens]|uniref:Uncharacterized protein n=1 Tax=Streptomyces sulfonofaciens TaxID=68272 RepID=A0A919L3H7_9ACTN|nr:hypothetical protein [Streptomyces sulfonofaciens]GHH81356.1 hypothetical protein GCM10018793_38510 [Streptomyces sulfonofaciens]
MATARLALSQPHQGDVDQACPTAAGSFDLMTGQPLPGRLRSVLGDYYRGLSTIAPHSPVAREWRERYRTEWSRT